jgi:ATP-dependent DNA helicase RecG
MNRAELERLLADDESDRVERTVSLTDRDKFGEAICAFANDMSNSGKPGYLFVGATAEGCASGAVIDDQLLQNLAAIRSDGQIQPLPTMNVQKWALGGGEMAVVEVFPSDLPPVRYRGRTCIRVGARRGFATPAKERILSERRVAQSRTWDARTCGEATLVDLALDLFTITYRPNAVAWPVVEEVEELPEPRADGAASPQTDVRAETG